MSQTSWPVASDVSAFLTDTGITAPSATTLTNAIAATVADWERRTRYRPFLIAGADLTPSARYYDATACSGFLSLLNGLHSLTSVTVGGTAKTLNTDFYYGESVAPYTYLRFAAPVGFLARTIVVTGVWGYDVVVPDDAWQAVLEGAALRGYAMARSKATAGGMVGRVSLGQGDIDVQVSSLAKGTVADQWLEDYKAAVALYKLRSL